MNNNPTATELIGRQAIVPGRQLDTSSSGGDGGGAAGQGEGRGRLGRAIDRITGRGGNQPQEGVPSPPSEPRLIGTSTALFGGRVMEGNKFSLIEKEDGGKAKKVGEVLLAEAARILIQKEAGSPLSPEDKAVFSLIAAMTGVPEAQLWRGGLPQPDSTARFQFARLTRQEGELLDLVLAQILWRQAAVLGSRLAEPPISGLPPESFPPLTPAQKIARAIRKGLDYVRGKEEGGVIPYEETVKEEISLQEVSQVQAVSFPFDKEYQRTAGILGFSRLSKENQAEILKKTRETYRAWLEYSRGWKGREIPEVEAVLPAAVSARLGEGVLPPDRQVSAIEIAHELIRERVEEQVLAVVRGTARPEEEFSSGLLEDFFRLCKGITEKEEDREFLQRRQAAESEYQAAKAQYDELCATYKGLNSKKRTIGQAKNDAQKRLQALSQAPSGTQMGVTRLSSQQKTAETLLLEQIHAYDEKMIEIREELSRTREKMKQAEARLKAAEDQRKKLESEIPISSKEERGQILALRRILTEESGRIFSRFSNPDELLEMLLPGEENWQVNLAALRQIFGLAEGVFNEALGQTIKINNRGDVFSGNYFLAFLVKELGIEKNIDIGKLVPEGDQLSEDVVKSATMAVCQALKEQRTSLGRIANRAFMNMAASVLRKEKMRIDRGIAREEGKVISEREREGFLQRERQAFWEERLGALGFIPGVNTLVRYITLPEEVLETHPTLSRELALVYDPESGRNLLLDQAGKEIGRLPAEPEKPLPTFSNFPGMAAGLDFYLLEQFGLEEIKHMAEVALNNGGEKKINIVGEEIEVSKTDGEIKLGGKTLQEWWEKADEKRKMAVRAKGVEWLSKFEMGSREIVSKEKLRNLLDSEEKMPFWEWRDSQGNWVTFSDPRISPVLSVNILFKSTEEEKWQHFPDLESASSSTDKDFQDLFQKAMARFFSLVCCDPRKRNEAAVRLMEHHFVRIVDDEFGDCEYGVDSQGRFIQRNRATGEVRLLLEVFNEAYDFLDNGRKQGVQHWMKKVKAALGKEYLKAVQEAVGWKEGGRIRDRSEEELRRARGQR